MEDKYFYFIVVVVFVLLGFILVDRLIFNRTILSFKKDLKELAKMKGDFVKLATLLQTAMMNRSFIPSKNIENGGRPFNPTDTQILVPQKELRRLKALERVYQDNVEAMTERKTNLLEES